MAHADGEDEGPGARITGLLGLGQGGPQVVLDDLWGKEGDHRHQAEFVPAITGGKNPEPVRRPLEDPGQQLEGLVPGHMAEGIVDFLERVDIQHEQGDWPLRRGAGQPFLQVLVEPPPVVEAGEGVVVDLIVLDGQKQKLDHHEDAHGLEGHGGNEHRHDPADHRGDHVDGIDQALHPVIPEPGAGGTAEGDDGGHQQVEDGPQEPDVVQGAALKLAIGPDGEDPAGEEGEHPQDDAGREGDGHDPNQPPVAGVGWRQAGFHVLAPEAAPHGQGEIHAALGHCEEGKGRSDKASHRQGPEEIPGQHDQVGDDDPLQGLDLAFSPHAFIELVQDVARVNDTKEFDNDVRQVKV